MLESLTGIWQRDGPSATPENRRAVSAWLLSARVCATLRLLRVISDLAAITEAEGLLELTNPSRAWTTWMCHQLRTIRLTRSSPATGTVRHQNEKTR